ncbi:ADP-ribose pyrophosphatase YjhB (NUDIX family) [Bacillus ectoiniformans]|uniref:NUDIX hydrolase n=1 Tax=Bacillus ectoiniformans TaxID=1494429 RepID=UPI0019575A4C|nr:NUDIX hydrolase [Bacillus ectoiniformans]MBM7648524.1 ADP-ribose pyrophosphatase YjhB (NUDIX family) [Bacillus ectoiniformans]
MKRGSVWLAAAGLVVDEMGRWLVVKKNYSGLKGQWSLPAGFVDAGETVDEAAIREVKEETGIDSEICGVIGIRTGVIREKLSDNMVIFLLRPIVPNQSIKIQTSELMDACWMMPEDLRRDESTSALLHTLTKTFQKESLSCIHGLDPGKQFEYTTYKLFF